MEALKVLNSPPVVSFNLLSIEKADQHFHADDEEDGASLRWFWTHRRLACTEPE